MNNNNNNDKVYTEYDENGHVIYRKYPDGREYCNEYDENGNLIYYKNTSGKECWKEYDKNNNCIYNKYSNGFEEWYEYDENNNCIHVKDNDKYEKWYEYDEKGNCIHARNYDGYEFWREYDKNNRLIHYKNTNGEDIYYKYDENGKRIECKPDEYNIKTTQNTNDEEKEQLLKLCDEYTSKVADIKNKALDNIMYLLNERCYKQDDNKTVRLIFKNTTYSIYPYSVSDEEYNKVIKDSIDKCVRRVYEYGGEELLNKFVKYIASEAIPYFKNGLTIKDFKLE